jgi:hypothetical protein
LAGVRRAVRMNDKLYIAILKHGKGLIGTILMSIFMGIIILPFAILGWILDILSRTFKQPE